MRYRIIFGAVLIVSLFLGFSLFQNYYAPCKIEEPYHIPPVEKDTLQVVFIGDSWAFFHKPHDREASVMLSKMLQQPVLFRSYGICGLTSREIYEQLFCNDSLQHFLSKGCHYCILSAGINDTYKKMSTNYYAKSMKAILHFLLYNNITPIIIEIPDYDIAKSYKRQTVSRKVFRHLSMFINKTPLDCKQQFREALDSILTDYEGRVYKLRYQEWNGHFADDQQKLYREDGLHLNNNGYMTLDRYIGLCISQLTNTF